MTPVKCKKQIFKTWENKVNGPNSVTYLDRTPNVNDGWLDAIPRIDTKRQVFKRDIGLSAQNLLTIVDQHNWGTLCSLLMTHCQMDFDNSYQFEIRSKTFWD